MWDCKNAYICRSRRMLQDENVLAKLVSIQLRTDPPKFVRRGLGVALYTYSCTAWIPYSHPPSLGEGSVKRNSMDVGQKNELCDHDISFSWKITILIIIIFFTAFLLSSANFTFEALQSKKVNIHFQHEQLRCLADQ